MSKPKRVFSIITGGPFHRFMLAARLISPEGFSPLRPALVVAGITWIPLMTIGLVQRLIVGKMDPILADFSVHARLLIAIPCIFLADLMLDAHCVLALGRFVRDDLAEERDEHAMRRIIERARRLRDSVVPEAIILLIAFGADLLMLLHVFSPSVLFDTSWTQHRHSAVQLWYAVLILPAFQFLVGRWFWHWAIWTRVLFDISRLRLRLVPTHPDYAGGIALLSKPIDAFAVFTLGASSVVAGAWYTQVMLGRAQARSFAPKLLLLVCLAELVAFGPLLVFYGHMRRARLRGNVQYSALATRMNRAFHERWILAGEPARFLLDRPDVSALTDLMSAYERMRQMRRVPFDRDAAISVLAATLGPMLPVATTEIPLADLAKHLAKALFSGLAG